jgi:hypothetical protein
LPALVPVRDSPSSSFVNFRPIERSRSGRVNSLQITEPLDARQADVN